MCTVLLLQSQQGITVPGDYPIIQGHLEVFARRHIDLPDDVAMPGGLPAAEERPVEARHRDDGALEVTDPVVWTDIDPTDPNYFQDTLCDRITKGISSVFFAIIVAGVAVVGHASQQPAL